MTSGLELYDERSGPLWVLRLRLQRTALPSIFDASSVLRFFPPLIYPCPKRRPAMRGAGAGDGGRDAGKAFLWARRH